MKIQQWKGSKSYYFTVKNKWKKSIFTSNLLTVGATRLVRATALARSLSNSNMEMFYKHFRLEIYTDWNSAFIQQISKKILKFVFRSSQNSVWNYFSKISPFFSPWQHVGSRQFLNQLNIFLHSFQQYWPPLHFLGCVLGRNFFIYLTSKMRNRNFENVNFFIYFQGLYFYK